MERPDKELKLESREEPLRMTYVMHNDIMRFVSPIVTGKLFPK